MIEVLNPGTRTTIQDAGRPGYRHMGIPASGAADPLCFALANYMAGNRWDAPALECTMGGLHLKFLEDTTIGLAGAHMWTQINGQNVENFTALPVRKNDILTMSFARGGCRAYIAFARGLRAERFLGSCSTYIPAKLGGLEGRALKAGDKLKTHNRPCEAPRKIPLGFAPSLSHHVVLRAQHGPEFDKLSQESKRHLYVSPYITSDKTDRMGARLRGNNVETQAPISMTSSPLLPGTLQVLPNGQTILALIDAQCTGGYPRALQVIKADQWLLGQIAPGTQVSFRRCFDDDAADILKARNSFYSSLIDGFSF